LNVENPSMAVGGFERGGKCSVLVAVKLHTKLLKSEHALRSFIDQKAHCISIAETSSGSKCVVPMASSVVVGTSNGCDASLSPATG
jgi:hypothetical protein